MEEKRTENIKSKGVDFYIGKGAMKEKGEGKLR